MISVSFPISGKNFVNREDILRRLNIAHKRRQNVALVGPRRIGKTSIAKEFLSRVKETDVVKLIFDVQQNLGTPSRFILRLIRSFLEAYFSSFSNISNTTYQLLDVLEIEPKNLLKISSLIDSETLDELAKFFIAYYPPPPENERVIFEKGFRFLDKFMIEKKLKLMLVLDEFQAIKELERSMYKRESILGLMHGIISSTQNSWYMFTGSMVRLMTEIMEEADSPFYGRVERINVGGFTKEDMISLIYKAIDKPVSGEAIQWMWALTKGNPYYIVVISNQVTNFGINKKYIMKEDVERAFLESITNGDINSHCYYTYDLSVGKAKKANMLKEIMKSLAMGSATPTEIASSLGKDRGFISPYLRELLNLSLIEKTNGKYSITDPILKIWLAGVYGYVDPEIKRIRTKTDQHYKEAISSLKKQRGFFFESYVRELFRKFDGSSYGGVLLPKFNTVDQVNIYDKEGKIFGFPSNVEIDALCLGEENWICEIRYRNDLVTYRDISLLIKKKQFLEEYISEKIHRIVFISITGFTESALKEKSVWCIGLQELNKMFDMYKMRKIDLIRNPFYYE
ncbi:MAG: ATP-binding protein [Deltaproteobacteria bacterium]|nr:ATP-binding protein [Deltaproteobacteria bacterium]